MGTEIVNGTVPSSQRAEPGSKINLDASSLFKAPTFGPIDAWGDAKGVQFFITFETEIGTGQGVVRLAEEEWTWKTFTVYTALTELKAYEKPAGKRRAMGVEHGWVEFEEKDSRVLMIGAGQDGLTVAARLKMLNVDSLIIDSNERVGENWHKRYHQLVLHDPIWYDHMPYIPFPLHCPVFTSKDKLGEFFESYSSSWDDGKKQWTVTLGRKKQAHIVQATGHSGEKNFPTIKGIPDFKGDLLCHSSKLPCANPSSKSKKAVNFFEKGYNTTIVQRSTTCVVSSSSIADIGLKGLYEEDGPPVEDADLWLWAIPFELFKAQQLKLTKVQNEHDKATLDGLRKAGFALDNGPDDVGLMFKYFQHGSGYYIDVDASALIAEGKIKVKQGKEIPQVLPYGLEFTDGLKLEADEIIFATRYQNMKSQARAIFGDEVTDRVGDVWEFNGQGELRTIWQRSGHPRLWFMGGNLALSRYYSRVLALQIKALEEGLTQ
ncbi:FAD/NAD(P)-binding domain-containing protein [Zopfia rhizophila CBS 207.26]|uniref:FAD/NAD(P)-binding domain-containing protein n=1 Tax=Zopfia rhizophila CBS 207.26 TaxID=1314779 RepID=A0A6A6E7Q2_9PEZI|nr:FAD/NAD(P)-binding domain-containing protein [Zopfia rhizophila CBS 207.26]